MSELDVNAAFDRVIAAVHERLSQNLRIRRALPGDGRLRLDRQLPFLVVYRAPHELDPGTRDLVTTEAAYLFSSGEPAYADGIARLCRAISDTLQEHFGALLLVEIWAEEVSLQDDANRDEWTPSFRIVAPKCDALDATLSALKAALRDIALLGRKAHVTVDRLSAPVSNEQKPLTPGCSAGCVAIGIAVRPIYRDADSGDVFPIVLQSLRRQLAVAIRKAVFAFTGRPPSEEGITQRPQRVVHYEALGPSAISKAARDTDQQLCEISQSFEFLLYSTPVNSEAAWEEFAASKYRRLPTLYYRPLPYHPMLLKRQLYSVPLEHVEDSTIAQLFERKQDELGQQLDALKNIGTPGFFYDSLHLHGRPDDELVQLADDILVRTEDADNDDSPEAIASAQVAAAAREHIDYYHQLLPDFNAKIELTGSIASALMVAHDQLLISKSISIRRHRLEPLLHHEVGTHLLTYFNGRQQPLRLLYAGFAGYEALQEGLAVLAEYFAGGLTISRTRTLAARVAAVHSMVEGASFIDTFDLLHHQRGIGAKTAFMTTLRVYRGGGLTKDALYLRGLRDLLGHLRAGHDLEPLYVGKISLRHVPLVQELRRRGLVLPPAVMPRFWSLPTHDERLEKCRRSTLLDLLEPS